MKESETIAEKVEILGFKRKIKISRKWWPKGSIAVKETENKVGDVKA